MGFGSRVLAFTALGFGACSEQLSRRLTRASETSEPNP